MLPSIPVINSGIIDDDRDTTKMKSHDELYALTVMIVNTDICTTADMID
jgi:hypothetical protein